MTLCYYELYCANCCLSWERLRSVSIFRYISTHVTVSFPSFILAHLTHSLGAAAVNSVRNNSPEENKDFILYQVRLLSRVFFFPLPRPRVRWLTESWMLLEDERIVDSTQSRLADAPGWEQTVCWKCVCVFVGGFPGQIRTRVFTCRYLYGEVEARHAAQSRCCSRRYVEVACVWNVETVWYLRRSLCKFLPRRWALLLTVHHCSVWSERLEKDRVNN